MHPQNVMKRRLFSLLLTLAMLLSLLPAAHALGEEKLPDEDGYGYTYRFVTRDTIEITSYYGYESEVVVPATIDGYTVVGIQSFHATEGYSDPNVVVRKVTLPDTVTYIADDAFYDSDDWSAKTHSALREIVLPQSLKTIGERAFYHNYYLEKITIPASVTEIGKAAFAACTNLSDITFQGEHTLLHGGAFGARTSYSVGTFAGQLSALYNDWLYDDSASDFFIWNGQLLAYKGESKTPVIPDTVQTIGADAFWRADITGVTIPAGVREIGPSAFYESTALTAVDIPGSVARIDDSAFSGCTGLTSVTLHEGLQVIGDGAFRECEGLTSLDLPDGLTTLEDTALYDCANIERFTFPASLSDMELSSIDTSKWYEGLADGAELYCGGVFLGCKGREYPAKLTVRPGTKMVRIEDYLDGVNELSLPDGLESLIITPEGVSDECGITALTVPESVDYIELRNMSNLTNITLPETAVLAEGCFSGCYQIEDLAIPKGNQTLYGVCVGRTAHVVLPDDVLEVRGPISNGDPFRYNTESGNSSLKSIDLGSVRVLTDGALSDCVALERVTLPDSLIELGDGVFSGCAQLRSVKGGGNVRQIGNSCFSACPALTDFGDLTANVTRVGSLAFFNTGWFHDQPNGVVYFGKAAYAYKGTMPEGTILDIRDGTVSVTYEFLAGQTELNPSFDQPNLAGLILPESCKYVDAYAFAGATNMKFLDLGGVQYIGREAFNNSACESIVLPDSVRYVGSNAFSAPNIRAIHLNDGLRALDEGAFFTYGKGSGVTIPASVTYIGAQALGWCPIDPDDPFAGLTRIDGFAVTGTAGSAAQAYAEENEFTFRTDAACTAHDYVTETVAATCRDGGFTRRTCAVCGDVTVTARGSAAAHTAVANDDIAATCDRPGATGGTHCGFCGQTLTAPTEVAALGHDWVVAVEEYEHSAYYGMTRHYCRRCALKWYDNGSAHTHDYSYQVSVTYPTCTAQGYTTHTCACGDSYRDSYVGALGHDYVGGVCTRCGAKASDPQPGTQPCDGGAQCPGRGFSDMPGPADWSHEGIDYAVSHGLFVGTSDTTFSPASAMTRAMLVSVLWRMEGEPAHTDRNPFTDVGREWYTDGVLWAAEHDIVAGIGDGRFDPDGDVTREQIAAILCRYTLWKGHSADARADLRVFPDAGDVSSWAYDSLAWANAEDLISGCMIGSISYLKPLDNATRAQVAAILMRYQQSIGA